jgi:diguanylate cyclase (GGDEF)-like protein
MRVRPHAGRDIGGRVLNRGILFEAIESRLARARQKQQHLGVLLLRLRRLREFRIGFGYAAADRMAELAHRRMVEVLRPTDTVLRTGEAEYVVIVPDMPNPDHALLAAHRLVRAFEEPLPLDERAVLATVAVGIACGPGDGDDADMLLRRAEQAYRQARLSVDRLAQFSPDHDAVDVPHADLHEAIVNNRLQIHLQALWDLHGDFLAGAESLARWNSPHWGQVEPSSFIPLAEQTGLITPLTRWSLNNTLNLCSQARRQGLAIPFSINFSPRVLPERGVVEQILDALRIWDVPPESIVLEVTETAVLEDPAVSARLLHRLRDAGLRISIDDFGTGHSSFSYLQTLPATELKIDKSFIADLKHGTRPLRLVRSLIDLARNLDMEVVAEGVEDRETLEHLKELGCDRAQGYYIGMPMPAAEFIERHLPENAAASA